MAKCDEGYRCHVCGQDVANITESNLYLRYVIGMLDPENLHATEEAHIRCDTSLAQFIVDESFPPVVANDVFRKDTLDAEFVRAREDLVTRGWQRLQELAERLKNEEISVLEYPLPEVQIQLREKASE